MKTIQFKYTLTIAILLFLLNIVMQVNASPNVVSPGHSEVDRVQCEKSGGHFWSGEGKTSCVYENGDSTNCDSGKGECKDCRNKDTDCGDAYRQSFGRGLLEQQKNTTPSAASKISDPNVPRSQTGVPLPKPTLPLVAPLKTKEKQPRELNYSSRAMKPALANQSDSHNTGLPISNHIPEKPGTSAVKHEATGVKGVIPPKGSTCTKKYNDDTDNYCTYPDGSKWLCNADLTSCISIRINGRPGLVMPLSKNINTQTIAPADTQTHTPSNRSSKVESSRAKGVQK